MRIKWLMLVGMMLVATQAQGQSLSFCEKGSICWTDQSAGKAKTELKITADDGPWLVTVAAGITRLDLVPTVRNSKSDWLCGQVRHLYPDGKVSAWYISEQEGVCKPMAAVIPAPVEPPVVQPPVVTPPPVVPPPVPPLPVPPLTNVTVAGNRLTFDYKLVDCPKGIQMQSGKIIQGQRTVTMTCRK